MKLQVYRKYATSRMKIVQVYVTSHRAGDYEQIYLWHTNLK